MPYLPKSMQKVGKICVKSAFLSRCLTMNFNRLILFVV